MHRLVVVLFCVFLILLPLQSIATPLILHNTGEGLVEGGLDPNWTVELPDGSFFGQAISATDLNLAWIDPDPPNTWISIVASGTIPPGTYRYSTTFNIDSGFNPTTASLSGFWWADEPNSPNGIYLNNVMVSSFTGAIWFDLDPTNAAFSITSGFVTGLNVLTFYVENTAGPGGTLIQGLTGSVDPIPEPTSLLLFGTGLGVLGLAAYRRKRK